jgi:hypothetical protein
MRSDQDRAGSAEAEAAAGPARRDTLGPMTDSRECAQCRALFAPLREHARFCSARCRIAWNRQNRGVPGTGNSVLDWSVAAMRDSTERLLCASSLDRAEGYAIITEAVWWCTMVEATLLRYHPDGHAAALARRATADRQAIECTFAGLRFVRNRMGSKADHDDFLEAAASFPGPGDGRIADWTWKQIPDPDLGQLQLHAKQWELTRHQAYQVQLAGRRVGGAFGLAASFLHETAGRSLGAGTVTAGTPSA